MSEKAWHSGHHDAPNQSRRTLAPVAAAGDARPRRRHATERMEVARIAIHANSARSTPQLNEIEKIRN